MQWIKSFKAPLFCFIILLGLHAKAMEQDGVYSNEKKAASLIKPKQDPNPKFEKKESDQEIKKEKQSPPSLSSSNLNSPMNSEEQSSKEEEKNDSCKHFYGLTKESKECSTFLDSRGAVKDFKIYGQDFTKWHEAAWKVLEEYTPKVRQTLIFKDKSNNSSNKKSKNDSYYHNDDKHTNLLEYAVHLIFPTTDQIKQLVLIEEPRAIWVSGWPGSFVRNKLAREFSEISFKFFDDLLPSHQTNLSALNKHPLFYSFVCSGYALQEHSYLIKERHEYLEKSIKRAEKQMPFFNQHFLHTEQALLKYLASEGFKERILKALQENQGNDAKREVILLVNIASYNSVCLHCADRIFRESEWGEGFVQDICKKSGINLKIQFLASSIESYSDKLKETNDSKSLREKLKKTSDAKSKIGFDGDGEISFTKRPLNGRQHFAPDKPYIAHYIKD